MERFLQIIKGVARLVGLYGQRVVKVLQVMMIHFEEIAAVTDQQQEELTDQLRQLLEVMDLLDSMIEQSKADLFEK